jgi:hypothetical protein
VRKAFACDDGLVEVGSALGVVLPAYDVRVRHSIPVAASSEAALQAARAVTAAEAPLLRVLYLARGIRPGRGLQRHGFAAAGENVLVAVGRPWTPSEGLQPVDDPVSFAEPGYAVMAMAFEAAAGVLATETRVRLTDDAARRRFHVYWLVVRPFSGLVRRSWLEAARRRAEAV